MNFVRSEAGLRKNCRLGPREQFNEVSSVLDAGTVYSNDPELLEELRFLSYSLSHKSKEVMCRIYYWMHLRLYKNGLMKTLPVFAELNYMDMMPLRVRPILHTFTLLLTNPFGSWRSPMRVASVQATTSSASWPATQEPTSKR